MTTLDEAYDRVSAALDTDRRSWIVGVVALGDAPTTLPQIDLRRVARHAAAGGGFPSELFAFHTSFRATTISATRVAYEFDLPDGRTFEARLTLDGGLLTEAFTRSGQLDDGSCRPSHVMLSDMEAVLVDLSVFAGVLRDLLTFSGEIHLRLGVVSDVPGEPLELRVYDEDGGDRLRPPAGYGDLADLRLSFSSGLSDEEATDLCYSTAERLAHAFGVFVPQLVGQARTGPPVDLRKLLT